MDDLKNFCCQNSHCTDYGRRGLDNLRVVDVNSVRSVKWPKMPSSRSQCDSE